MIVLAYCAGLRLGEFVRLTLADVHVEAGEITIRETKFFKSRTVPLTDSVIAALRDYLAARRCAGAAQDSSSALFWHGPGDASYSHGASEQLLANVLRRAGLKPKSGHIGPRIHDLRHNSEARIIPSAASNDVALSGVTGWAGSNRCSELSEALQEVHNAVAGSIARYRDVLGGGRGERPLLQLHVCV
jgi:integrase